MTNQLGKPNCKRQRKNGDNPVAKRQKREQFDESMEFEETIDDANESAPITNICNKLLDRIRGWHLQTATNRRCCKI